MILQSLVRLAEREGLVEDPDYEVKEVHWRITVNRKGRFIGLESLLQAADTGRARGRPRGPSIPVPRPVPASRQSGTQPDAGFLVGNASFVCGLDLTEDRKYASRPGELDRRTKGFGKLIAEAADAAKDEALRAVREFLALPIEVTRARKEVKARAEAGELVMNHLISFRLEGDVHGHVHRRPSVMRYWAGHRAARSAGELSGQCLITGVVGPTIDKHPPIKKLPGGTPSGVAIVSFNHGAFESYGFSRNENAPVSRKAAEAYTAGLNRLLEPAFPDPRDPNSRLSEQRVMLSSDTVAVFWTDEPSRVPAAIAPAVAAGDPEAALELGVTPEVVDSYRTMTSDGAPPVSPAPLRETHEAPWRGIRPGELQDPSAFRLLILSGGQGRATVRSFHTSKVSETVAAVRRWFEDIRLETLRGKPALQRLLNSLAVRGEKEHLSPNLAGEVFLAALGGSALPVAVLEAAIRRCRSETTTRDGTNGGRRAPKVPAARVALVKAYLNRARLRLAARQAIRFEEVQPAMNDNERNKGYLLGRMFACVERMQELALGDVGASVTDRYFSAGCATPQAVFPRLLKMEVHHYRKAREGIRAGTAHWLHGQIGQLATWLVGEQNGVREGETFEVFLRRAAGRRLSGFPHFLPLPEQGLFTLGYHQQRAEFFKRRGDSSQSPVDADARARHRSEEGQG